MLILMAVSLCGIIVFCIKFGIVLIQIACSLFVLAWQFVTLVIDLAVRAISFLFNIGTYMFCRTTETALQLSETDIPDFQEVKQIQEKQIRTQQMTRKEFEAESQRLRECYFFADDALFTRFLNGDTSKELKQKIRESHYNNLNNL